VHSRPFLFALTDNGFVATHFLTRRHKRHTKGLLLSVNLALKCRSTHINVMYDCHRPFS